MEVSVPQQGLLVPDKPGLGGRKARCPIVGVGASAGGLEAFQAFVGAADSGQGLAYVLVQHLDPNHESLLPELLARCTTLPVSTIVDGQGVAEDHIYLLPPNREVQVRDGHLYLLPFSDPRGQRRPIDTFFRSLAEDQTSNAACVVLSGTGADGAAGLRAVKEAGGLTVAQVPAHAKYDGMPNSAVATGLVDLVLDAGEMPAALQGYFRPDPRNQPLSGDALPAEFISRVCDAVRGHTGHDFGGYKAATVGRRIARRMQVVGTTDPERYLARLGAEPNEGQLLFRDLLINVTNFFRDNEAFEALRLKVLPILLDAKGPDETLRIWVAGCSSGEEAYSIAMLAADLADRRDAAPKIAIFATDIDPTMLSIAREAHYPASALADVPPELLDRHFVADEKGYRISSRIRDMVSVSEHSVIKDPPFSRLDLVSCRNLLIYLTPRLQSRVIQVFHYALRKGGCLMLGPSENLGEQAALMEPVDAANKIYRRTGARGSPPVLPLEPSGRHLGLAHRSQVDPREQAGETFSEKRVHRRVLEHYAPPFVVLNGAREVVYASNRTGRYLEMPMGTPSRDLLDLARPGLRQALRGLLSEPVNGPRRRTRSGVAVRVDDREYQIDLVLDRIGPDSDLLVFSEAAGEWREVDGDSAAPDPAEDRIAELEEELAETRLRLRTTVEELETSNEELKSSNEEMMSMNEELQSANEELATINDELKTKIDALAEANDDIRNFLESTRIATLFLDREFRIRSFTPEAAPLLGLSDIDKGRDIGTLRLSLDSDLLRGLGERVMQTLEPEELPVAPGGHADSHLLRVLPYRGLDDEIRGTVYVLTDVSDVNAAREQAEAARQQAVESLEEIQQLYRQSPVGLALLDETLTISRANDRLAELTLGVGRDLTGLTVPALLPAGAGPLVDAAEAALKDGPPTRNIPLSLDRPNEDKTRHLLADVSTHRIGARVTGVSLVVQDVTVVRERDEELRRILHELQHRVKNMLANVMSLVRQAKRSPAPKDEALTELSERLDALARTSNLLAAEDWRSADLEALIEPELIGIYGADRSEIGGPKLRLNSRAAMAVSMGIHEMATNAAKYGALSNDVGTVSLRWSVEDQGEGPHVVLRWIERGGPPATPPDRPGFGTTLIRACFEQMLGGSVETEYGPSGVSRVITVPRDRALLTGREVDLADAAEFGGAA